MNQLAKELLTEAISAIDEFGATVKYYTIVNGVMDLSTGKSTSAEASVGHKALLEDGKGTSKTWDQVQTGDMRFTMAATGFTVEPSPVDRIGFCDKKFSIVDFETFYVGETPVLYVFHGRRAG